MTPPRAQKVDLWRLWGMASAVIMVVGLPLVGVIFRYVIIQRIERMEQTQVAIWQQIQKYDERMDKLTSMLIMLNERVGSKNVTGDLTDLTKKTRERNDGQGNSDSEGSGIN